MLLFSSCFGSGFNSSFFNNNGAVTFCGSFFSDGFSFYYLNYFCFFYRSFGVFSLVATCEQSHAECYSEHKN